MVIVLLAFIQQILIHILCNRVTVENVWEFGGIGIPWLVLERRKLVVLPAVEQRHFML